MAIASNSTPGNSQKTVVTNLDDAHQLFDIENSTGLKESRPSYSSISCNLPKIEPLKKVMKPTLVGGTKLMTAKAQQAFLELVGTYGYPNIRMP